MLAEMGKIITALLLKKRKLPGARGGLAEDGIRIHSVRLPGLIAHQEVILGQGQVYTLRHDTSDRACYMPGGYLQLQSPPAQIPSLWFRRYCEINPNPQYPC